MTLQFNPYAIPLFVGAALLIVVAAMAWQRRTDRVIWYFLWFTGLGVVLVVSYGMELLSANLTAIKFWLRWEYMGHLSLVALMLFVMVYTGYERWVTRRNILALLVLPLAIQILVWTNDAHGLIWSRADTALVNGLAYFDRDYGPVFWVWIIYLYATIALTTFLALKTAVRAPALYRGQLLPLVLGSFVPWIGASLTIMRLTPIPYLDLTPYGVAIMWGPIAISLLRFRLMDLIPVAHDSIVESMRDAVLVLNARGQVIEANRAALLLTNATAANIIGQPFETVFQHPDMPPDSRYWETNTHIEIAQEHGAETRYLDIQASPMPDWRGQARGWVITIRDITARKIAEKQTTELALERERIGILSSFIRDASHEFRTPLTVIQSSARILEKIEDPQTRKRQSTTITDQTNSILRLVDDLASMTRLDSTITLPQEAVDINAVVNNVIRNYRADGEQKRVRLEASLAHGLPQVRGSESDLNLALSRVVSNAIRYSALDSRVVLCTRRDNGMVVVEVRDTGCGIAEKDLPHIFERFYRADTAHTTSGFGLGLSITHRVVALHGGRIDVSSRCNEGTTFAIRLPVEPAPLLYSTG